MSMFVLIDIGLWELEGFDLYYQTISIYVLKVISYNTSTGEGLFIGSCPKALAQSSYSRINHFLRKFSFLLEAVENDTIFGNRPWLCIQLQEHHTKAEHVLFKVHFICWHIMSNLSTLLPSQHPQNNHPPTFMLHKKVHKIISQMFSPTFTFTNKQTKNTHQFLNLSSSIRCHVQLHLMDLDTHALYLHGGCTTTLLLCLRKHSMPHPMSCYPSSPISLIRQNMFK